MSDYIHVHMSFWEGGGMGYLEMTLLEQILTFCEMRLCVNHPDDLTFVRAADPSVLEAQIIRWIPLTWKKKKKKKERK